MSGEQVRPALPRRVKHGRAGERLVAAVLNEMQAFGLVPSATEDEALHNAAELADAIAACRRSIAKDGPVLDTPSGTRKANPALTSLTALTAAQARLLASINTTEDSTKDPAKVRAGQARWRAARAQRGA